MRIKFFSTALSRLLNNLGKYKFFFDMDGTVVNTEKITTEAHVTALKKFKNKFQLAYSIPCNKQVDEMIRGRSIAHAIKSIGTCYPEIKKFEVEYKESITAHYQSIKAKMPLAEYIISPSADLLKTLLDCHAQVCIVSGASREEIRSNMAILKLQQNVPYIGSQDYTNAKPSPESYLKAAALLGTAPDQHCIAFEDSEFGVRAAKSAGMRVIGVALDQNARHLAAWGCDAILTAANQFNLNYLQEIIEPKTTLRVVDSASQVKQKTIACWAIPRSMSTALENSFRQRTDTHALYEPFYSAHYNGPERSSQRFVPRHKLSSVTYKQVEEKILAPSSKPIVFFKDMGFYVNGRINSAFIEKITNTFLIRNPKDALISHYKVSPDFFMYPEECGYFGLAELFNLVRQKSKNPCLVIDADDLCRNPAGVLQAYCQQLDIPFSNDMLNWKNPAPAEWQEWHTWHERSARTHRFEAPTQHDLHSVPSPVVELIKRCEAVYHTLYQYRLKPFTQEERCSLTR